MMEREQPARRTASQRTVAQAVGPAQGRLHRHAGARAAQSAGADPQRGGHPAAHASCPMRALAWCRDVIDRQVTQMTHLLEDLLDVSRVTRNKVELRRDRIAIAQAIDQAIESTRPLIESQGHELQRRRAAGAAARVRRSDAPHPGVRQPAQQRRQVHAAGRPHHVLASRDGDRVRIVVRDSGVGIASEQLAAVFDMFAQFTPALDRAPAAGSASGWRWRAAWSSCTAGRILAFSAGPGRGSEFVVATAVAARRPPARRSARNRLPRRASRRGIACWWWTTTSMPRRRWSPSSSSMARTCASPTAARKACASRASGSREVAVLDIGMPDLNGYEVCRRIRVAVLGAAPLLVACTGWGQPGPRSVPRGRLRRPSGQADRARRRGAPAAAGAIPAGPGRRPSS